MRIVPYVPDATKLLVFPAFSGNPYLKLMEQVPLERGFDVVSVYTLDDLHTQGEKLERDDVLHVHWTSAIAKRAADEEAASAAVDRFTRFIDELRAKGVRIVWTVHNRLPHEFSHLEPELALCRFLADRADIVHVMSEQTSGIVADLYPLPAHKVRVIPHPSYEGVYDLASPKPAPRERFQLAVDEATVLAFGRMRPYKGIDTLFAAVTLVSERGVRPPTVLLAGMATKADRARIEGQQPSSRVVAHFGYVPDDEVVAWFRAADVAVFAFKSVLNSGTVHLAATLGVPAIMPGEPHLRAQFGQEPWVRFYDVDDAVASLADLIAHPETTDHSEAMAAFSRRYAPSVISEQYADVLDELVGFMPSDPVG